MECNFIFYNNIWLIGHLDIGIIIFLLRQNFLEAYESTQKTCVDQKIFVK